MALVAMTDMLKAARAERRAVGAFMIWSYDSARAIADAAQALGQPVIFIIGYRDSCYLGGPMNVRKIAEMAAASVDVPIVLHADHFQEYRQVVEAIEAGYTSVMIDASRCPFEQNVERTCAVVEIARRSGVSVEAELGRMAGLEDDADVTDAESFQTDPEAARRFVARTGVDALAVAFGTVHGAYTAAPRINVDRVRKIAAVVSVPLVMHGGSGTPDEAVVQAIRHGIAKINVATELVTVMGKTICEVQHREGFAYSVPSLYAPAREACRELVERKIRLFSGLRAGR
jgi:ketose-bisphosphate aldolase